MVYSLGNIGALILASQEQLRLKLKDCREPQHYYWLVLSNRRQASKVTIVYNNIHLKYQNATSVLYQELQKGLEVC